MKIKLLSLLLVAISSLFALSSCDGTSKPFNSNIDFSIKADCDATGISKITSLFKNKGLPVGANVTISVIVDIDASAETSREQMKQKVEEILRKSATLITPAEFHALGTTATYTNYIAFERSDSTAIDSVLTDYGRPKN